MLLVLNIWTQLRNIFQLNQPENIISFKEGTDTKKLNRDNKNLILLECHQKLDTNAVLGGEIKLVLRRRWNEIKKNSHILIPPSHILTINEQDNQIIVLLPN